MAAAGLEAVGAVGWAPGRAVVETVVAATVGVMGAAMEEVVMVVVVMEEVTGAVKVAVD